MEKLKACPFCGDEAFLWKSSNSIKISCKNNCVTMPSGFNVAFTGKNVAISAWNNRYLDGYGE